MKTKFRVLFGVVVAIFLSLGCATPALWKDGTRNIDYKPYEESIDAFMINPSDKSMVFIGEKYHYIFESNSDLSYLMEHRDNSMDFQVQDGEYRYKNGFINASFNVAIDQAKATKETREWLQNRGRSNISNAYIALHGKRYTADPKVNAVAQKLSKGYKIKVTEITDTANIGGTIGRAIATPVALAADGVIIIGAGVVLLFMGIGSVAN